MKSLKIISRIFAVLATIFLLLAILIATGIVGSSNGFLDLSNVVAISVLGIALVCSIIASITSLIYKLKMKQLMSNAHTIIDVAVNVKKKDVRQTHE